MQPGDSSVADVCIVGAGLVGGLMAHHLASAGIKVVVLEAGPQYPVEDRFRLMQEVLFHGDANRAFASDSPERDVFSNGGSVKYPLKGLRAKGVGGSTLHWGAQALRFFEEDFRLKTLYGIADDWPITYAELEPYYAKVDVALGVAGNRDNPFESWRSADYPLPGFPFSAGDKVFLDACDKLGIKVHTIPWARNSQPYDGRPACAAFSTCGTFRVCPTNAQYTSERHIARAVASGNATVIANASVVRLVCGREGEVARAVYADEHGREFAQEAKIFVIAANAVESARLLLLSQSGQFPDGLANGSGMVGRNFMEHPGYAVRGVSPQPVWPYRIGFSTAQTFQFCKPKNRHELPSFKVEFNTFKGPTPSMHVRESGNWGDELAAEVKELVEHHIAVEVSVEQLPDPENRVVLDSSQLDSFGNPAPKFLYSLGEYERKGLDVSRQQARDILRAAGAGDISDSKLFFGAHQMGTVRMGDDPATSVVNRNLRAHEVANLYVVGGSNFVTGSSLQPSLTIAALAIRAAEHIADLKT